MLSSKLLATTIKNGATNEETYELIRLIFEETTKKTYYSLLKNDKHYQSLLSKIDEAEKKLNQQEMLPELKDSLNHFIELSEELEDESHAILYLSAFLDSYHFFKALGLIAC